MKPRAKFAAPPLTRVPSYPDLPMEDVYPRQPTTDVPDIFLRELDRGRVAYFPGDIDRTFWEVLNTDHAKLLGNAVLWANNEPAPLSVEGKGVLDVAIWSQKNSMTVHLVNLTNPMMMKGPVREAIPISSQQVRIRVPAEKRVTKVHLLVAGVETHYRKDGDAILVEVPSIRVHEVIALDFAV